MISEELALPVQTVARPSSLAPQELDSWGQVRFVFGGSVSEASLGPVSGAAVTAGQGALGG